MLLVFAVLIRAPRRNLDHGRPQQSIADAIAARHLCDHGVWFVFVRSFGDYGFVDVRIESFANRRDGLDAERFEHLVQLFADEFDAMKEMPEFL